VLIGHINKEGIIAGPKVLEHLVDTVIQFEGDRQGLYRILRSLKNRFGSTHEMGFFEMEGSGLREVLSPSDIFISDSRDKSLSGCSVSCIMEGSRGLLVEVQALVSSAVYGTPQRVSKGYDTKKLNMVLAVLEKRCGFRLSLKDVFLNITGGFSVEDPGIDLAVVLAILSSNEDIPIDPGICVIGELGLSGEIRSVNKPEQRILEAIRLGFSRVFIPAAQVNTKNSKEHPGVIGVKNINELFTGIFG
jgi:DNA repair protein RadA/Sms